MTAADTPQPAAGNEAAPAKINLFLHLRGRRPDGYHRLESLAVFPGLGDRILAEPGPGLSLALEGPFAADLAADGSNLVLRAAALMVEARGAGPGIALRLEKWLPVASGIGGGSADAAATLRLLGRLWAVPVPVDRAHALGADVPVCIDCRPQWMAGIGERLAPGPSLPRFWMVLANPMVSVATASVFAALTERDNPPGPAAPASGFRRFDDLVAWLAEQRNDLQATAERHCPPIAEVMAALAGAPLARMSGSGATCFALHAEEAAALAQAEAVRHARPDWWVVAAPVAAHPAPGEAMRA